MWGPRTLNADDDDDYLSRHCTKFQSTISGLLTINASIFQGTSIRPVSYIFNSSDLVPCCPGNRFNKYADDTYILVPPSNYNTIMIELENISQWAIANNLKLNSTKSTEMVVSRPRVGREHLTYSIPIPGIQRIDMMKILDVSLSNTFSFNAHIDIALRQAAQSMYALRVLRSHGLTGDALWDVTRDTTLARMLYASPAWWGYADIGHRHSLDSHCKTSYSNYRGWDFCHKIPLHLKICVALLMNSFLHPCSGTSTMYWHNSFLRLKKPHISSVHVLTTDLYLLLII